MVCFPFVIVAFCCIEVNFNVAAKIIHFFMVSICMCVFLKEIFILKHEEFFYTFILYFKLMLFVFSSLMYLELI